MARSPLILATRRPPFPLDNGARIRTQRLAAGLAERFDLTLVTFADGPRYDDADWGVTDLERVLPGVRIELVPYGRDHPGGLRRTALWRHSATWGAYATPTLRQALARLVDANPGAVLHLDDPGVALAGLDLPAALRVFAPHNIEHRILREIALASGPLHRPFLELEWRKIAAEERRLWRDADLCLAVSDVDAATMSAGGARHVEACPNGADPANPPELQAPSPGEPLRLLFVGSIDYWPYERGIAWFVREALPHLRAHGPVTLDVVGSLPRDPVPGEGVTYHGRVPDVRPYWAESHALVMPVFQGSGTRLKAVEAAVQRRPMISTALGVEGLPLEEGRHYIRAETAEEFAHASRWLRRALSESPAEVRTLVDAAHTAVDSLLWPTIVERLAELYEGELAGLETVPAAT